MNPKPLSFRATVWRYPGHAGWHFCTLPINLSDQMSAQYSHLKRGFGSLPIKLSLNDQVWETSMFPDKHTGCFIIPLKKSIRTSCNISNGDTVSLNLVIRQSPS